MKKLIAICGISGTLLYVFAAILGQMIVPSYNPVLRTISMLVYAGAPHKLLFDTLFILSNSLFLVFSIGLFAIKKKSILARIGALLLALSAILQIILLVYFPVQSINDKMTTIDYTHQSIVNVTVVFLIVAVILIGTGLNKQFRTKRYLVYSLITAFALLIVGLITSHEITSRSEIRGLWERIMILIFLQWIVATSIKIYNLKRVQN